MAVFIEARLLQHCDVSGFDNLPSEVNQLGVQVVKLDHEAGLLRSLIRLRLTRYSL
jgi:hypothetical protein